MAKRQRRRRAARDEREICFVMCPFDDWHNDYCKVIYNVGIEAAGLKPLRADDLFGPSPIMGTIWKMIRDAKVVLADVSGRNPNVLYELGLAHALAKPAILLSASIADVPFDLKSLRVLEYDVRKPTWAESLRTQIRSAIKEVLANPALYVPLPYIEERPSDRTVKVRPKDKAKIETEQRLQSLSVEIRGIREQLEHLRAGSLMRIEPYAGTGILPPSGSTMAELARWGESMTKSSSNLASLLVKRSLQDESDKKDEPGEK